MHPSLKKKKKDSVSLCVFIDTNMQISRNIYDLKNVSRNKFFSCYKLETLDNIHEVSIDQCK